MANYPLTYDGFSSGWLQRFFNAPFDPICVMLAMRSKLLLDLIDEMGHSYNLMRRIGFGWIDFGDIPGEIPGDPGDYYPPLPPIPVPPLPPGPGDPGYMPPTPPGPGDPGYIPTPGGGPSGGGGNIGNGAFGFGPGEFGAGSTDKGDSWSGGGINCCKDKDDPSKSVTIGYSTLEMNCGDHQGFTVIGADPGCKASNYSWELFPGMGSIDDTNPLAPVYTAPDGGAECDNEATINLYCLGNLVDSITIIISTCPASASIGYTTQQMSVNQQQTLSAVPVTAGCGTPVYDWAITSGGGTLSASQGASVVYTAPATNQNCLNNPTIKLSCNGVELDTLKLAVSITSGTQYAYARVINTSQTNCIVGIARYWHNCLGNVYGYAYGCSSCDCSINPEDCYCSPGIYCTYEAQITLCEAGSKCSTWTVDGVVVPIKCSGVTDIRTVADKNAGCCPAALL